ncbi:MAG: hypothetical protein L0241_26930, partial [Planctomycetia bacterium]|nr:hypothetical protein [Planctomycetia bacterium]
PRISYGNARTEGVAACGLFGEDPKVSDTGVSGRGGAGGRRGKGPRPPPDDWGERRGGRPGLGDPAAHHG